MIFLGLKTHNLLEILGHATNPLVIQTHLKKLFAGIHAVKFDEKNENIVAMGSLEGELVPLASKVKVTHSVEAWLEELAREMKATLQRALMQCLQESKGELGAYNVEKYPSQVLCLAEGVNWMRTHNGCLPVWVRICTDIFKIY